MLRFMIKNLTTATTRDAPKSEKKTILILIFFRGLILIPLNTESESWTGNTGFQLPKPVKLDPAFHIYMIAYNF